jgi:hypothetical protein
MTTVPTPLPIPLPGRNCRATAPAHAQNKKSTGLAHLQVDSVVGLEIPIRLSNLAQGLGQPCEFYPFMRLPSEGLNGAAAR